ncbi:MAG TPA: 4-hydroxy-2-oxovalerate aldolase [Acidimicrobiia bacterium]
MTSGDTPYPAKITVVDSTLRDGSHAKRHRLTVEQVRAVAGALDGAGVPWVEVSHGDGLGGSSLNYGLSLVDELELIAAATSVLTTSRLAVLLLPGIGTKDDLARARDLGAALVRVATHCTEADIAPQHLGLARDLGMTAVGFLMMAHLAPPEALATQARIMADAGAEVVYVTDSAGALLPSRAAERVEALRAVLPTDVAIGFHGHMNLDLGVANSIAAVRAGATWVDGATCGMGAGAGNTPTEVLAAVCDLEGIETGIDTFAAMDVAEDIVRPILDRLPFVGRSSLLLGYCGVYGSFLLHAEQAAKRFGVSEKEILLEVGRRKAVGGQEDMIVEVGAELAGLGLRQPGREA